MKGTWESRRAERAAKLEAERAANVKPEPPPKRKRSELGNFGNHRPKLIPEIVVERALRETFGNASRAAKKITEWQIEQSDEVRRRREKTAARQGKSLDPETEEERKVRHAGCRVPERTIRETIRTSEHLQEVKRECVVDLLSKARDGLSDHVLNGNLTAIRYILDRRDPDFMPRQKVSMDGPPQDPLDAGSLPEEEQRRLAGDDAEEP